MGSTSLEHHSECAKQSVQTINLVARSVTTYCAPISRRRDASGPSDRNPQSHAGHSRGWQFRQSCSNILSQRHPFPTRGQQVCSFGIGMDPEDIESVVLNGARETCSYGHEPPPTRSARYGRPVVLQKHAAATVLIGHCRWCGLAYLMPTPHSVLTAALCKSGILLWLWY